MQNLFSNLTDAFRENSGEISKKHFQNIVSKNEVIFEDSDTIFILLQASGFPIIESYTGYILQTYFKDYKKDRYCILDIETNGSKQENSQVIEVGAILIEDGKIIDKYESLVKCMFVPQYISKITGINQSDLINAPSLKSVLTTLKNFMGDAIFVAHNVDFDYNFLNDSFDRFGLGNIGNPQLCTIELARRTFESPKYGLAYLIEFLEIDTSTHHRAYSDAYCALKVFEKSLQTIPKYVKSSDELIAFAKSSKKARRLKNEQMKKESNL